MPDSEDPKPPVNEAAQGSHITQPTEISDEKYHALADEYLDAVHEKAEQLQEGREDVDVEYSSGVMNITFPPNGTYVLNKQPPNKQIWISSPISGPKRYDWVLSGESMHQKEGSGNGEWVYLRDGTDLTSLLHKELGILIDPRAEEMKESKDPVE
ncbi:Frataxin, mitochondrial [Lecanosticta acicola]|uniref:ferroxidase n=1 Tax=Lecanosticta acicola TaxID=111012 RepID=A0AAI8YUT9_9PEZI|nr:Frataxin, mitochondrial [Lecanosticta acicola]